MGNRTTPSAADRESLFAALTRLINEAEVRLATIRFDHRDAIPSNPSESVGAVVQAAEARLEEAKRLIRDAVMKERTTEEESVRRVFASHIGGEQ